jgi:hypothetical protein
LYDEESVYIGALEDAEDTYDDEDLDAEGILDNEMDIFRDTGILIEALIALRIDT